MFTPFSFCCSASLHIRQTSSFPGPSPDHGHTSLRAAANPLSGADTDAWVQGGIELLVEYVGGDEAYLEGAAWALQAVAALHPANQAAAQQAGIMPTLVGLMSNGPDSITTECAARCLHALVQVMPY